MANGILRFEWDSKKAASNLRKHRVSFEEAALIFNDEFATFYEDPDHSQAERRYLAIGISARGRLLIVAFAYSGERIRIINARRVTTQEREMYEEEER
jgi:uncharacterized DUF497 family protein